MTARKTEPVAPKLANSRPSERGPLAGVRVVTMALNIPGPLAVARLRTEGAQATKIEPLSGDPLNAICPTLYHELHREVRVEPVDLKTPAGSARLHALLADADVERGKTIVLERPSLSARDALHVAVMQRHAVARILSFDAGFDAIPGLTRIF